MDLIENMFDLDLKKLSNAIFVNSPLEVIIKGNLFIEEEVNTLIELHLKDPKEYFKKNYPYANKLDLAVALSAISKEVKNSLGRLNKIRNSFAHDNEYILTEKDFEDIWSTLTLDYKTLFTEIHNLFKINRYNVYTPQSKFQLLLVVIWSKLRSEIDWAFPHKRKIERIRIHIEYLEECNKNLQKQIESKEGQNRIIQEQILNKREHIRNLQEEILFIKNETAVYKEQFRVLRIENKEKRNELIKLRMQAEKLGIN